MTYEPKNPPPYYKNDNISKVCERCGSDNLGGLVHLPHVKKYIALCPFCYAGLGIAMYRYAQYLVNGEYSDAEREEIQKRIDNAVKNFDYEVK